MVYAKKYNPELVKLRIPLNTSGRTVGFDISSLIAQSGNLLGSAAGAQSGSGAAAALNAVSQGGNPLQSILGQGGGGGALAALAGAQKGMTALTSGPGAEVSNIIGGVNALTELIKESQTQGGIKDAWFPTKKALQIVKAIPVPVVSAAAMGAEILTNILYDLFGDKPCDFQNEEECKFNEAPDGLRSGFGKCCNPYPIATGRGVMVGQYQAGNTQFPGHFGEIPAGNYYRLDGQNVPREYRIKAQLQADAVSADIFTTAPRVWTNNDIDTLLVPDGWQVTAFTEPGFKGKRKSFGPGWHDLRKLGWGDAIASMQVRGTWSIIDSMIAKALDSRTSGWITERAPSPPTPETILMLLGLDPLRPKSPGYVEYDSVWRPGWYLRLSEAGVLDSAPIKMVFQQLGLTDRALQREKVISMEKTLDTLGLLLSAAKMKDETRAANLINKAMNVEQKEIAKTLSRYKLNEASINKLQEVVSKALTEEKKKAGIDTTKRVWAKKKLDLPQLKPIAETQL